MPCEGGPELNADYVLVPEVALGSSQAVFPPIHVIDFEGTRESGIVEYGVATILGGAIESAHTRACGPAGRIHPADQRLHGLSREGLKGLAPFTDEWALFADLRQSGPFCAHNAVVEDGLIRLVWPHPRSSPDFSGDGGTDARWGPWLDTLHLYRKLLPALASHALEDLIAATGLEPDLAREAEAFCPEGRRRYHCALYDALASALLLLRLVNDPALRERPLSWWLATSASSKVAREGLEQRELF